MIKHDPLPEYTDGALDLYRIVEDKSSDYPLECIRKDPVGTIWYKEIAVYDRTRADLSAAGIEVTMKLRIPQYKKINSKCVCIIEDEQHEVYNAAHVVNKYGFPETEITLRTPRFNREVIE